MDTKHEGLPVVGYRSQSEEAVAVVNENKALEERILRQLDRLAGRTAPSRNTDVLIVDPRWLAIARTSIEQGFMALNRSVFRPGRISLPEDAE